MLKQTTKKYSDVNVGKNIQPNSFLSLFPILRNENGEYVYNLFRPYVLNEDIFSEKNMDVTILRYNEWWENIAYDYYGFPEGWWIIALTNGIVNPFEEIDSAQTIYQLRQGFLSTLYSDMAKVRSL